jgi:hypothetical protein
MDLVAPSFLNNLPAVLSFNKKEEEPEPKLKEFVRRIEDVESAVQDTTQKIDAFMSMLDRLDEHSSKADGGQEIEEHDEEESSSDDEQNFEIASASLIAAESALFEAKRRIGVAEIAYREAEQEFNDNSAKILSTPVEPAKPSRKQTQAETSGSQPFVKMLGLDSLEMITKNLHNLFVSAQSHTA